MPSLRRRLFLGVLTALLFVVGAALCVEAILFCCGVRPETEGGWEPRSPLFLQSEEAGDGVWATARNKRDFFNYQEFLKEKPPGRFRIFCLGGSTTYGRPYWDAASFCGWLREMLPQADPTREWEVINAGGISYGSYRVAELTRELAQYDPDLFILYTGHNEFLERGPREQTTRLLRIQRRMRGFLGHSRAFSALARVVRREGAQSRPQPREEAPDLLDHEVNAILDNTVGPTSYVRDDAWHEKVLRDFRTNLGAIADVAEDAGAQLLCIVPASNLLNYSPFKSEFQSGLSDGERERCEALLAAAEETRRLERPEEALGLLDQALAIEDRYARLHYDRGRVLYDAQRYSEARESLERARDEDICPLRASGTIQKKIAEMAKERGSLCVDFDTVIRQRSSHGIPDATFFPDHVHLTVEGNGILAGAIMESLIEAGIVNPSASWGDGAIAQVAHDIDSRLDRQAQGRALYNLSRVMAWAGKTEEALSLALRALEFCGADTQMLCHAGALARMQGDLERATAFLEKALRLAPDDPRVHTELGLLLKDQAIGSGDRDLLSQAGWHFRRSVDLARDDGRSQGNLANTLAMTGHPEAARHHFEEAIRLSPNLAEVRVSYGFFLMRRGEREAAVEQLQQALKLDPSHTRAQHYLKEARSGGER